MTMWVVQTVVLQGPVMLVVPTSILIGMWASRRRILERPSDHRRLLTVTALFGLRGERVSARGIGPVSGAVSAVGKRSMSSYLAQSVLCAPILAAWGLGLGGVMSSSSMALYAIGVWMITLAAAVWLERRGKQGPAEYLIRRLTYRAK